MLNRMLYIVCWTILAFGFNHLVALFLHGNLEYYGYSSMIILVCCLVSISIVVLKGRETIKSTILEKSNRWMVMCFIFLNGIVFIFLLGDYVVDLSDYAYEMSLEMYRSNSLFHTHPYLGTTLETSIPTRIQILFLPGLYASILTVTGMEPYVLLAHVVPVLYWLLGLLSAVLCAKYIYKDCNNKIWRFLIIYTIAFLTLRNVEGVFGYQLFYAGYSGDTLRTIFLIPCSIYATFTRKWFMMFLVFVIEAFTVWTTYGVGYCFLVMLLILLCTSKHQKIVRNE